MSRCATQKIQVSSSKFKVTLQISSNINPLYGFCEFESPTTQKATCPPPGCTRMRRLESLVFIGSSFS
ncbi:hypothetical protein DPMN_152354 [Dreissena polymorpha]|uniref:Uncharacterized protein n=1 Tax=Dreissena polymorpha TaxID=45954 RepID=A0A9D4FIR8_DREPO|nr:hypothetical protein DPMN_152354 [Dreissena polymorpha]